MLDGVRDGSEYIMSIARTNIYGTDADWHEVTKGDPCPACDKPDWCGRSGDAIRCMRITDAPPGWQAIKHDAEGGTTFVPADRQTTPPPPRRRPPAPPPIDWTKQHAQARAAVEPGLIADWADAELGLTGEAVDALLPGWLDNENCAVFPERDETGTIIGLVRRTAEGKKIAMKGSRRGLTFAPPLPPDGVVVVVEGASDTAAAMAAALVAVGRPSAKGGGELLAKLLIGRDVVIVGENDKKENGEWPGREGAEHVAGQLAGACRSVRIAYPPPETKDVRSWLLSMEGETL